MRKLGWHRLHALRASRAGAGAAGRTAPAAWPPPSRRAGAPCGRAHAACAPPCRPSSRSASAPRQAVRPAAPPPPCKAAQTQRAVPEQSFARLDSGSRSSGTRKQQLSASSYAKRTRLTAAASENAPSCGGGRTSLGASPTLQRSCTAYGTPAAHPARLPHATQCDQLESTIYLLPCPGSSGPWWPRTVTLKQTYPLFDHQPRGPAARVQHHNIRGPPRRLCQHRTCAQVPDFCAAQHWRQWRHARGWRLAPGRARLAVQIALRDSHIRADALVALHLLLCAEPRTTGR